MLPKDLYTTTTTNIYKKHPFGWDTKEDKMSIGDYLKKRSEREADEMLSNFCARVRSRDIAKEVSRMIQEKR